MIRETYSRALKWVYTLLFLAILLMGITPVQAELTLRRSYDQTNYQEIQDLLFPALLNWVKKGEFVLQTGRLEFEWKKSDAFLEASQKNEGKYGIDKDGLLIEKSTGKLPEFVYGFPFPKIDPKDPKVAEKIMENQAAQLYSLGSHHSVGPTMWVGAGGKVERQIVGALSYLFYRQRPQGPIPNPHNLLSQRMITIIEPFDFRGSNSMYWSYNDQREDTAFIYISSIRRARRVSTSNTSNPSLGGDIAADDGYVWSGKNASMKWRLIGEKNLLVPFSSTKKIEVKEFEDGSIDRAFINLKLGYEVPGWKGASWYPVDAIWSPRPCWVVEATPKNSNYLYGKQILYIDKEPSIGVFKEVYNKDGQYWKTYFLMNNYQVTPSGRDLVGAPDLAVMVDDKTHHSTIPKIIKHPTRDHRMNLPLSVLGPKDFTEDAFIQLSK